MNDFVRENKTKKHKKFIKIFICIVTFLLMVSLIFFTYMSCKTYNLVQSSWDNYGILPGSLNGVISENDYDYMCRTTAHSEPLHIGKKYSNDTVDSILLTHTYPIVYIKDGYIVCKYQYTQEVHNKKCELLLGAYNINCEIYWKYQNGHWVVEKYHESA